MSVMSHGAYSQVFVIYNPNSTGPSERNARRLQKQLAKLAPDLQVEIVPTTHSGHAENLAYQLAKKQHNPLLVSASGDGGYHELINGAMRAVEEGAAPVCAVLPSGNANDHARNVQDSRLHTSIAKGEVDRIDLLAVEYGGKRIRYAHSYVGLGLSPAVAVELNRHSLNPVKEAMLFIKSFYKLHPFDIEHKGKVHRLDSLIFSNIPQMAKVLTIGPNSEVTDGKFEVSAFPQAGKIALIRSIVRASVRQVEPDVSTKQYTFTLLQDAPMQLDGEVIRVKRGTDITITSAKHALTTVR